MDSLDPAIHVLKGQLEHLGWSFRLDFDKVTWTAGDGENGVIANTLAICVVRAATRQLSKT